MHHPASTPPSWPLQHAPAASRSPSTRRCFAAAQPEAGAWAAGSAWRAGRPAWVRAGSALRRGTVRRGSPLAPRGAGRPALPSAAPPTARARAAAQPAPTHPPKRLVIEPPWLHFASEYQRFGNPLRLNHQSFWVWAGAGGAQYAVPTRAQQFAIATAWRRPAETIRLSGCATPTFASTQNRQRASGGRGLGHWNRTSAGTIWQLAQNGGDGGRCERSPSLRDSSTDDDADADADADGDDGSWPLSTAAAGCSCGRAAHGARSRLRAFASSSSGERSPYTGKTGRR
jgi:hypothetical protein